MFGAAPSGNQTDVGPRLIAVDAFPEEYRVAVGAVIAAMSAEGYKPGEYFASIHQKEGVLEIHLTHESHPPENHRRGDTCGKCRITHYNPKNGRLSRFEGIR